MIYRADIGAISVAELKSLELAFLFELDFRLLISPEEYERATSDLLLYAALRAAGRRPERPASPPGQPAEANKPDSEDSDDGPVRREPADEELEPAARSLCDTPVSGAAALCPPPCFGGLSAGDAAATAAISLVLGRFLPVAPAACRLKRDRAPSPPPGPVTPERPLAARRSEAPDGGPPPVSAPAAAGYS